MVTQRIGYIHEQAGRMARYFCWKRKNLSPSRLIEQPAH